MPKLLDIWWRDIQWVKLILSSPFMVQPWLLPRDSRSVPFDSPNFYYVVLLLGS
jgi:hypothetical protein